jgi:hypothetical protein
MCVGLSQPISFQLELESVYTDEYGSASSLKFFGSKICLVTFLE